MCALYGTGIADAKRMQNFHHFRAVSAVGICHSPHRISGDFFQAPAVAVNLADDPFAGKFYEIRVVGSMDGKLKITVIFFHFLSGKT